MLIKYKIRTDFKTLTGNTVTVGGDETLPFNVIPYKSLTIPISLDFTPTDYSEDLQDVVIEERKKAINKVFDAETTRYKYINMNNPVVNSGKGLIINFRFFNQTTITYDTNYTSSGLFSSDITNQTNAFRKSFFRLYFYDSITGETNTLLFTEDIDIDDTTQPTFSFNNLYWLRNDDYFIKNNTNRLIYMNASFFNSRTGKVLRFMNLPTSYTTTVPITDYNQTSNKGWRYSPIELINPKLNGGNFNFRPYVGTDSGANTSNTITMSEISIS